MGAGQVTLSEAFAAAEMSVDDVERTVREHARFVYKVAYSVLRNHHDAEDAAQETFLRVMKHAAELAEVREIKPWLARIAWRIAVDKTRQRPAHPPEDVTELNLSNHDLGADDLIEREQMGRLLERMIATLPADLRQVITLSTVQEMSSADVAQVLRIPEASVRTRMFRARQLLKEKMAAVMGKQQPARRRGGQS